MGNNPSRHIFRLLNSILNEFWWINVHNPTLIDENRLGMASENTNFQVEFSKRICFFSSSFLSLSYCLFWFLKVRFPSISGLLRFQNQNKSLHKAKNALIICLKEFDSVEFFDLYGSVVRNWSKWKLKISEQKISISEATH